MEHKYISQAKSLYPNKYDYSLLPITFKKKDKLQFKCIEHNNIFEQSFDTMLRNQRGCTECRKEEKLLRLKTESEANLKNFINESNKAHNNSCDYSKVVYKNQLTKVTITCKIHNIDYEQLPSNHIKGITGCPKCISNINKGLTHINTKEKLKFITPIYNEGLKDKLNSIHNNKYEYYIPNNVKLKQTDMFTYTCKEHGIIKQKLLSHLQGHGCKDCGNLTNGWNKSTFIKRCKNNEGHLYLLKMYNENEEFYKIGITSQTIKSRYKSLKQYNYKIISDFKLNADIVFDTEIKLKQLINVKNINYKPLEKFYGSETECFTKEGLQDVLNILTDVA